MAWLNKQRIVLGLLAASVAFNVGILAYLANSGGLRRIFVRLDLAGPPPIRAPFQVADEQRFRLLPNTPAEVVFAGDSLIADGPWAEFYSDIHNRGIGGDRTDGVLGRLDEILASRPKQIIFLIGANDLSTAVPPAQILRNYRTILTRVRDESPATRVVVLALWPVNQRMEGGPVYSNADVRAVNDPLRNLVGEFPQARFIDLADQLADAEGQLKPELSKDGLHLNIHGYLAIAAKLRTILDGP